MSEIEGSIRFEVLGPIRARIGDSEITISAKRDRIMLAMLLLHAPDPVPLSRLVEAIWGDQPPNKSRNQVQGCVSRWRKQFADAGVQRQMIVNDQAGYRIPIESQDLDLLEFRRLCDEARSAAASGRPTEAYERYRAALGLWRGPALVDIDSVMVGQIATSLDEEHIQAQEECLRLALEHNLAEPGALVAEIQALVRQHPYREALQADLLRALYLAGRQADALAAYREFRQRLSDELGTEPGEGLQRLHRAILNRDQVASPRRSPAPQPPPTTPVPRELPAQVPGFAGRTDALATLDSVLKKQSAESSGPVVISAIAGTAGVGKTALAVHWAHRHADRFPDGQLYLNLRGYASGPPMRPIGALAAMLRSLDTPPEQIPTDEAQAASRYRTALAGRRMLVVLDNAATADQVRPLLPGSADCLVLVTSRDRLSGLIARDGARRLTLDVLTPEEAQTLLTHVLGAERAKAEPDAVAGLAAACAHLPLALRVAAANLADDPPRTIADYLDQLIHGDRLGTLQAGDDQDASVLATLDLSYQNLPADTARLYRLLGLHSGPDIDLYGATALAKTTLVRARRLVNQLLSAHLLQEPTAGRFAFHDLVRDHAARVVATTDPEPEQQAALCRLLDYYRHTTSAAMDIAHPYERERRPRVPDASSPIPDLSDQTQANQWLDAELSNLLAIVRHAASSNYPEHTWHLSATLYRHLHTRGRNHDAEAIHRLALAVARTTGNHEAELAALTGLGDTLRIQGRREQAIDQFQQALVIARQAGSRTDELFALVGLGDICVLQGRHEQAIDQFEQALVIARQVGSRTGELWALIGLAFGHEWQGRYEQAIEQYRPALEIARAIGSPAGEMEALNGLGHICRLQGQYEEAINHFEQVLNVAQATGNRPAELAARNGLADIHRLQGRHEEAITYFEQMLDIARAIAHRAGELSALRGLGYIHRRQSRYETAIDHYRQVLTIAQEIGDRNWQFEAFQGLGRTQHATNQPEGAIDQYRQALQLATDLGQPADQARAHDGIAHAYYALRQHRQARQHWQSAMDILIRLDTDHTDDEEATLPNIRTHLDQLPH
jgi:tetratricopeptide (TPR) repeat protein